MKINELKNYEIKQRFSNYLKNNGYSEYTPTELPSTVYNYPIRIDYIVYYEKGFKDWFDVIINIKQLLQDYDFDGVKSSIGNKSHRAVINSLKRFYEFLNYLEKYENIEYSHLVNNVMQPLDNKLQKEDYISNELTRDNIVQIDDIVVWEDLEDNTEIKRQICQKYIGGNEQISCNAELAQKSIGKKQGTIVIINEVYKYKIKKIIK